MNDKKIDFPTNTDHRTLPNTAEEIKQQKIEEEKMFLETQLKKNERDAEMLENLLDEAKRDIIETFSEPSVDVIVDDIINVNDWQCETENKNRLEQSYGETVSKMIKENNAEILAEIINTAESKESLISKKIVELEKCEGEELAEKIKPSLELFLRDYSENENKDSSEEAVFKRRKSKRLTELKKKSY